MKMKSLRVLPGLTVLLVTCVWSDDSPGPPCSGKWSSWSECRCPNGKLNRKRNCQPLECTCAGNNSLSTLCTNAKCVPVELASTGVMAGAAAGGLFGLLTCILIATVLYRNRERLAQFTQKRDSIKWKPQIVYMKPATSAESRDRPSSCHYVNTEVIASGLVSQGLISALHSYENLLEDSRCSDRQMSPGYQRGSYAYPKPLQIDSVVYENYRFSY